MVMAATGGLLILFVIAHLAGNLLIFAGPEALNSYAARLQSMGGLLWLARLGLLAVFVIHLYAGLKLYRQNRQARPEQYRYEALAQTDAQDRLRVQAAVHMATTGLVILAFVVFHLLHFTFGYVKPDAFGLHDAAGRHDVYRMVVLGFGNFFISGTYVIAMLLLGAHLIHGMTSMFQTLGINHPAINRLIRVGGPAVVGLIVVGNCSMPLAVLFGWVGLPGGTP
jgi:succinate dehydrogenase / fumarate reductase cytochrome b subunit